MFYILFNWVVIIAIWLYPFWIYTIIFFSHASVGNPKLPTSIRLQQPLFHIISHFYLPPSTRYIFLYFVVLPIILGMPQKKCVFPITIKSTKESTECPTTTLPRVKTTRASSQVFIGIVHSSFINGCSGKTDSIRFLGWFFLTLKNW